MGTVAPAGADGASAPSPTSLGCGGPPGRSASGDVVSGARHRAGRVSALAAERSGRWLERGRLDAVIAGLLFMAGMRRSEVSARRWADVADAADGDGVLVTVRRSKTNQEGEVRDVRFVKGGVARAIRTLRAAANPAPAVRVVPLSPKMVRLQFQAAARAGGVEHVTAHSGRVGLASELTSREASNRRSRTRTWSAGSLRPADAREPSCRPRRRSSGSAPPRRLACRRAPRRRWPQACFPAPAGAVVSRKTSASRRRSKAAWWRQPAPRPSQRS